MEVLRELMEQLRRPRKYIIGALLVVAAFLAYRSVYIVGPSEKAVVMTFGEVTDIADPGIHFAIPGVHYINIINIGSIRREVFGYRDNAPHKDIPTESIKVTKDGKIVSVSYVVQFIISNPEDFVINPPKDADERGAAIRDIMESRFSEVINNSNMDDLFTIGKEQIQMEAMGRIQSTFNEMKYGISITQVVLQDAEAPNTDVKDAFARVNTAAANKNKEILAAQQFVNVRKAEADGEAAKILNDAEAYAQSKLAIVTGECERINSLVAEFEKDPELVKQNLYLESAKSLWDNNKIILIEGDGGINILPLADMLKEAAK